MINFQFDLSDMVKSVDELDEKLATAVLMLATTEASRLESKMKSERAWADRTGDAKKSLTARASSTSSGVRITLSHGMDYGVWLEFAHGGKYAIIEPTLRRNKGHTMKVFRGMLNRINKGGM